MSNDEHRHLVEIDESTRHVVIHRVLPNGSRHLLTRAPWPEAVDQNGPEFDKVAYWIGEIILLDSPAGRRALRH
jgi:hypothetical protein